MKFQVIAWLSFVMIGSAYAADRPLTAQELGQYKAAVYDALNKQNFNCTNVKGLETETIAQFTYGMQGANIGTIDIGGAQPLLSLTYNGTANGKPVKKVTYLVTSPTISRSIRFTSKILRLKI